MSTLQFPDETKIVCITYMKLQAVSDAGMGLLVDECEKFLATKTQKQVKDYSELVASMLLSSLTNFDQCENEACSIAEDLNSKRLITQDRFNRAVRKVINKNHADSLQDITSVLHLLYLLVKKSGVEHFDDVVQLTIMSFMLLGQKIIQHSGWLHINDEIGGNGDLSSSIVLVPEQVVSSTAHVATSPHHECRHEHGSSQPSSPPATPPFNIISDEGEESMDSATPPEIIDKPQTLTASLMQLIDHETSSTSKNGDPSTPLNTPNNEEEEVASAPPQQVKEEEHKEEEEKEEEEKYEVVAEQSQTGKPGQELAESMAKVSQYDDDVTSSSGTDLSSYIPHISLGVAAAAACIGLFVMKK